MQLGMVGLGRMGANIVRRLMRAGHECVVYDVNAEAITELAGEGATGADSLDDFVAKLDTPRAAWVMVPAGEITESTVNELGRRLESGDAIIDGGNSYYRDDIRRAGQLADRGIDYIDCGTSGGVFGLERGYCLMIGGPDDAFSRLEPIFAALAPGVDSAERTPGRSGDPTPAEQGYLHCGPNGAGHFVKMVHNGIEYGIMAAYAEGLNILRNADVGEHPRDADAETAPLEHPEFYKYDLDLPEVAEVWRRGSVDRLVAARPHRGGAARLARPRRLRGPRLGLRRGPLDLDRRDRGGRSGAGAQLGAVLALRVARPRRLRRQGAVGDAQAVRRPRGEEGLTHEELGDAEAASRRSAELIGEAARAALAERGSFSLALSGGNSPLRMFELLGEQEIDWDRTDVFQVDERIAPDGDPDRNLTHMLEHLPSAAVERLRPMPVTDEDLEQAAARYGEMLPEHLDIVHLGLGPDGHTASLVPGDPVLDVSDRRVALTGGEYQGRRRMTMTYPQLDAARAGLLARGPGQGRHGRQAARA